MMCSVLFKVIVAKVQGTQEVMKLEKQVGLDHTDHCMHVLKN